MTNRKRSLSQTGGPCRLSGDPERAKTLAHCLNVDAEAKMPFTHGFHAYPARMHPETARRVIEAFPASRVLDPFVGSGTTAVEAVRAGIPFVGSDVSKVALEIAWIRTRVMPPPECRRVEIEGHRLSERAFGENERSEFQFPDWAREEREWYEPHTLREVCVLKAMIDAEAEPLRRMHTAVLSSLLVKLSRQVSDSDPKKDLFHRPRPRHATFRDFRDRCSELTKAYLQLSSDLYKRKVAYREPELRRGDARTITLPPADLVFTSPPYAGTYDYSSHHARRFPLYGETAAGTGAQEIGSRADKARRYETDLEAVFKNVTQAAPRMILLIGDGVVLGGKLKADQLVTDLAARVGLRLTAGASQKRRDWSGGPAREEHLLLVER